VTTLSGRQWQPWWPEAGWPAVQVWALRAGNTPLLIACKLRGSIPPAERAALVTLAKKAGARPILAHRITNGWVDLTRVTLSPAQPHVATLKVPKRIPKNPEDPDPQEET
jgi:hypothetical protein